MKKLVSKIKDKFLNSKFYKKYEKLCNTKNVTILLFIVIIAFTFTISIYRGKLSKCEVENIPVLPKPDQTVVIVDEETKVERSTILAAMGGAKELVTYKYYTADVDVCEKDSKFFKTGWHVPFTTDKSVFAFKGVVSVGIRDLSNIEVDINEDSKKISIVLPKIEVLYNEMSSFKSYDVKNSIFTSTSLEESEEFKQALLTQQEADVKANNEFWEAAKQNTKDVINSLFVSVPGISNYDISYSWK